MSAVSTAANAAGVDWSIVAAAIGTFIGTIWLTIKGLQKGKSNVESGESSITSIVGASLVENSTIKMFTEQLKINNDLMQLQIEVMRQNTAALTRATDMSLIQNRKLDYRDGRDNPA